MKVTDNVLASPVGMALPLGNIIPAAAKTSLPLAAAATVAPPPNQSGESTPDPLLELKINSLKEKQRANSFFNSLPPEQARQIMEWIGTIDSLFDVWKRVTSPAPEGLGLKVHIQTLRRLKDAWCAEDLATLATSSLNVVMDLDDQVGLNHAARFQTAMNELLCERAFAIMQKQTTAALLPELLSNIQKLTNLELKRQKLQLQREKILLQHKSAASAPQHSDHSSVQHHRVDLNIVPPNQPPARETVIIESEPPTQSPPAPAPQPKTQPKLKPVVL